MMIVETHSEWWYRWTWLKARTKGMPLGYRKWRRYLKRQFLLEAMVRSLHLEEWA